MKIVSWCSATIYRSILSNGFCNRFKFRRILSSFIPRQTPYFEKYSLLKKDFQYSRLGDSNLRHKTDFPNKNEFKRMVSEKKKYAKGGDGKSNFMENRSKELSENKLDVKSKSNKEEMKKFRINDVICDRDLQIKIDFMLKSVEKGKKVFCDVVSAGEKNQLNEVLKKLNDSKLKNYVNSTRLTPKRLIVTYFEKASNTKPDKEQEKEENKS